jgi:hypothetical protein
MDRLEFDPRDTVKTCPEQRVLNFLFVDHGPRIPRTLRRGKFFYPA